MYYELSESNLPWHKYERYLLLTIIWQNCKALQNAEVQFMGFPTDSIEKLIETFDWSICLFGYDLEKGIVTIDETMNLINKIKSYDPTDQEYKPPYMKLHNVQFPISNLRRGFKFESRYPIKLDYPSILKLCKNVIKEHRKIVVFNLGNFTFYKEVCIDINPQKYSDCQF